MIKIRIRNAGHEVDVRFPISESELFAKLAEVHTAEHRDSAQLGMPSCSHQESRRASLWAETSGAQALSRQVSSHSREQESVVLPERISRSIVAAVLPVRLAL